MWLQAVGEQSLKFSLCSLSVKPIARARGDFEASTRFNDPNRDGVQPRLMRAGVEAQRVAVVNVIRQD
jgi:hypothetical protein